MEQQTTDRALAELRALVAYLRGTCDEYHRLAEEHTEGGDNLMAMVERYTGYAMDQAHSRALLALTRAESHQAGKLVIPDVAGCADGIS